MTNVLLLLALPEKFRNYFHSELSRTFPEVRFQLIDHVSKIDPHVASTDVLMTFGAHLQNRAEEVFRKAVSLKWVQAMGTGVDNIAEISTLRQDVLLTNIHGIHGAPMSEAAFAAMLALSREVPRVVRNQERRQWDRFPARLLDGKTVGVLGVGAIAEALAPRCKVFGMTVVGITSSKRPVAGFDRMYGRDEIESAVRTLDFLVLLTPHSPLTHHIVNAQVLGAMKPGSFLINLARGGIVDEAALLEALQQGRIGGAALDVFAREPLPEDHPFWSMPNVLITPHLGGLCEETAQLTLPTLEENLRRFLAGDTSRMVNVVKH